MLTRVIHIKNIGRFRNSATTPNPAFNRETLIFGANGYGKSTFCSVLRSLSAGDPTILIGRKSLGSTADPEVDFLFSDGNRRFREGEWSNPETPISIFDGSFISDNVHSGDTVDLAHKRNLYRVIIGAAGVGLARREQEIAERARAKQAEITAAQRQVEAIKPRTMLLNDFVVLPEDPEVEVKLETQRATVAAVRQSEAIRTRTLLSTLTLPVFGNWEEVFVATLDGVANDAEERVRQHLERHAMQREGQEWLSEGLAFESEDECPFCGRGDLSALELVRDYRTLFGEGYAALRRRISEVLEDVNRIFGVAARSRIEATLAQNAAAAEFWNQYCTIDMASLVFPEDTQTLFEEVERQLTEVVRRKSSAPLEPIVNDVNVAAARAAFVRAELNISSYNRVIERMNEQVQGRKNTTAAEDLRTVENQLEVLDATKLRYSQQVRTACDEYQRFTAEKAQLELEKETVRTQLEEHSRTVMGPYQNRINYFLKRFNAGFRITGATHGYPGGIATSTYQLSIDENPVDLGDGNTPSDRPSFKNTLSSGDKSTLALAFFLASLERESDLTDRIVVFDDPFNSQDAFRRRQTVYEIMEITRPCAQVIIFSHDPSFLKHFWEKCDAQNRAALQLIYHASTGTKLATFDIENACLGRAQSDLDDLMIFRSSGAGNLREVIRKLRIVAETHMRSAYTGAFDADDNCGDILAKIRTGGDQHPAHDLYTDLERINDYTAQYHHGEDPGGATEAPIDRDELTGFVEDTLRLVNALPS